MLLQGTGDDKHDKSRLHLDLRTADLEKEVERIVGLGPSLPTDPPRSNPGGAGAFTAPAWPASDPEGGQGRGAYTNAGDGESQDRSGQRYLLVRAARCARTCCALRTPGCGELRRAG